MDIALIVGGIVLFLALATGGAIYLFRRQRKRLVPPVLVDTFGLRRKRFGDKLDRVMKITHREEEGWEP